VRFILTAGQKGDAPQAGFLIEGLPADVVMADTAYDADHFRQAVADKGALAVIPNNPSRACKHPLDKPSDILSNASSASSSSSAALQRVMKEPHGTISPSSLSPPSLYGSD